MLLLLLQDKQEQRWFALRFAAGCSAFVVDGALLTQHHAVPSVGKVRLSVICVIRKDEETMQWLHDDIERRKAVCASGSALRVPLEDVEEQPDEGPHPRQLRAKLVIRQACAWLFLFILPS